MRDSGLDAALNYARRGWWILPCRPFVSPPPPDADPLWEQLYAESKQPVAGQGLHHATTDLDRIRMWWSEWPNARPAVNLAASRLFVLDHDNYKPGAARLPAGLPATRTAISPRDGRHLFFAAPRDGRVPRGAFGLDVKYKGYVILPAPGSGYRWEDPTVAIAAFPARLMGATGPLAPAAVAPVAAAAPASTPAAVAALLSEPSVPGRRSEQAYRFAGVCVAAGLGDAEVLWLASRHAPTVEKYGTRLPVEVGRMVAKLRLHHNGGGHDSLAVRLGSRRGRALGRFLAAWKEAR